MKPQFSAALLAASFLIVSSTFASRALAANDSNDSNGDWEHHHHHMSWAVSVSPRYYGLNSNAYSGAFSSNGLNAPKSGTVGLDFSFYWQTESAWQIGFGIGSVDYSSDNGSNTADYNQSFVGLWLAKDIQLTDDVDFSIGGLFGYGEARVEVLSTNANGRTDEGSFILEPKLTAAYRIAPWMKLGISGSYIEPLAESDSVKGQTLTTGNISLHGASGGVEFIFGHFGTPGSETQAPAGI